MKNKTITLSNRDRDIFLKMLQEDTPTEALKEAVEMRNELISNDQNSSK